MTEQDCQQVYQELAAMLQDLQLGWVVEQVESRVPLPEDMDSEHSGYSSVQAEMTSSQAVLTKPVTHTAQEKLLLLIAAAERIVIDTTEIKGELINFLSKQEERLNTAVTMGFASDDNNFTTQPVVEEPTDRRQVVAELRQLLQALRQEATSGAQ
jgi:hypothetical protein